jgi:endonuclease YncB( thermonuclease family)
MLNDELIRAGLSPAETQYPYRSDRKRLFEKSEQEARRAGRGLWGE